MSAQCQINSRLTTSTPSCLTRITEKGYKVYTQIRKYVVKDKFFTDGRLGQLICKLNCCCGSFLHLLQFVVPENFHPEQPFCKFYRLLFWTMLFANWSNCRSGHFCPNNCSRSQIGWVGVIKVVGGRVGQPGLKAFSSEYTWSTCS